MIHIHTYSYILIHIDTYFTYLYILIHIDDLRFGVFRENGRQLKYVVKYITHTTSTLRAIPSGVQNHLAKLTSRKPSIHYKGVDKTYHDHVNTLRKAGLAPPKFLTMGDLCSMQDEKVDIDKEPDVNKKKNRDVYFCVAYSRYFSTSIHRVINRLKILLTFCVSEDECYTIDLIISGIT